MEEKINNNTNKIDLLDKQFAVFTAELGLTMKTLSNDMKGIRLTVEKYIDEAKSSFASEDSVELIREKMKGFATKQELETLKADGKYSKLWNGLVGGCIGVIVAFIIMVIVGTQIQV